MTSRLAAVTFRLAGLALLAGCGGAEALDAGATPDAGHGPVSPLRVATWNLESFPRHPDTVDAVARLVAANDFDVVAVQEIVEPAAFEALAAALPEHEAVLSSDAEAFHRVGFLYRSTRLEVSGVDLLFGGDRFAFPRSPLSAELTLRDADGVVVFDLTIVVLHLKALLDDRSQTRRAAAVEALDRWMRARIEAGGDPDIVVLGDFNDELTDPPEHNVFGPLLGPEEYRFLTLEPEQAGERSFLPFDSFLDHILVTRDALGEYGAGATEVLVLEASVLDYTTRVSDHRPVVATFELP